MISPVTFERFVSKLDSVRVRNAKPWQSVTINARLPLCEMARAQRNYQRKRRQPTSHERTMNLAKPQRKRRRRAHPLKNSVDGRIRCVVVDRLDGGILDLCSSSTAVELQLNTCPLH